MQLLTFILICCLSRAQGDPQLTDIQTITQQGSLFLITITKSEPIRIYVVGNKLAEIDLSTSELDYQLDPSVLTIQVRHIGPKLSEVVKVKKTPTHYELVDYSIKPTSVLEITARAKGKKETFKFKVNNN